MFDVSYLYELTEDTTDYHFSSLYGSILTQKVMNSKYVKTVRGIPASHSSNSLACLAGRFLWGCLFPRLGLSQSLYNKRPHLAVDETHFLPTIEHLGNLLACMLGVALQHFDTAINYNVKFHTHLSALFLSGSAERYHLRR